MVTSRTWQQIGFIAVIAVTASSCGDDAHPIDDAFAVRGSAIGITEPVVLVLAHPGGSENLPLESDGQFAFAADMEPGAAYSVNLQGAPPCILQGQDGVVEDADPHITVTCDGVASLSSLALTGPVVHELSLAAAQLTYALEVPLLQQSTALLAVPAYSETTMTLEGEELTPGVSSALVTLAPGVTSLALRVSHPLGLERIYQIDITRGQELAQHGYVKASNTDAGDRFGYRIAMSGDTLAVGAYLEDSSARGVNGDESDNGTQNSGAVYVFRRSGAGWVQEAYIKASNPDANDQFGASVALDGDLLVVGAHLEDSSATGIDGDGEDNSAQNSGAAYVFRRTGSEWAQEAYLKASNTNANDYFGFSVAVSGDIIAVGARQESSNAVGVDGDQSNNDASQSGAVYVFRHSEGTWEQEAYVKASNTGAGDWFGASIALHGEHLAVGAPREDSAATGIDGVEDDESAQDSGAVYVFRRSDEGWQQEAYVKASNTRAGDGFGTSVALHGNLLAAGAVGEDSDATGVDGDQTSDEALNSGAVYLFRLSDDIWAQEVYLKASNTRASAEFGRSVAVHENIVAVGSWRESSNATGVNGDQGDTSASESGAAYVFYHDTERWEHGAYVKASNTDRSDWFGWSVAVSKDTLAVGAFGESSIATGLDGDAADNSAVSSGAVYVFY